MKWCGLVSSGPMLRAKCSAGPRREMSGTDRGEDRRPRSPVEVIPQDRGRAIPPATRRNNCRSLSLPFRLSFARERQICEPFAEAAFV